MQRESTLKENLKVMKMSSVGEKSRKNTEVGIRNPTLVRDGIVINVSKISTSTSSSLSHIGKDCQENLASQFLETVQDYFQCTGD